MKLWVLVVTLAQVVYSLSPQRCWKELEITFMVDHKKCVGKDIQDIFTKPLLRNFVKQLRENHRGTIARVALISYGEVLVISHSATDAQRKDDLLVAINELSFQPGNMGLDDALEECRSKPCFSQDDAADVQRIIVVLSNGEGDDQTDLPIQAKHYAERGFEFFSHDVDDFSSYEALKSTLNVHNNEQCKLDFVGDLALDIKKSKCPDLPPPVPTSEPAKTLVHGDIVFVIDSSFSLSNNQYKQEIDFAKAIVNQMEVGESAARFSAIGFHHRHWSVFPWTADADEANKVLDKMKANFNKGYATRTGTAMLKAIRENFGTLYEPRVGRNAKVIIVITDGSPSSSTKITQAKEAAKSSNIDVLAVGVGPGMWGSDGKPNPKMLAIVNSDESRLFLTADHAKLTGKVDEVIAYLKTI